MIRIIKILLLSILFISCDEQVADISQPKVFNKNNFRFKYPNNWTVFSEMGIGTYTQVILHTSADSLVIIELHEASEDQDFKEYVENFSKSIQGDMSIGKIVSKGTKYSENEIIEDFSIEVLGTKVPHKRYYFKKLFNNKVSYILFQLPTDDESKVIKGYDLIKLSIDYKNP